MMTERRNSERMQVKKKIMLGVSNSYFLADVLNISENGIAIQSEHVLPPNSKIAVQLHTGSEVIKLDGVVAWVLPKTSRMGIKLIKTIYEYNKYPIH